MFDVLILQEAAADASTAAAKTVFGPMQMLEEGGAVTWTIAIILAVMSIVSWLSLIHISEPTRPY